MGTALIKTSKYYDQALTEAQAAGGDRKKTWRLLNRAYKSGDPRAAYAIGTWYLHGKDEFIAKDLKRAIPLLREAAYAEHADAAYDLAVCYENGIGVKKSARRAVLLYLRGALLGEKQSIYEVGRCYWYGIGVKRDRAIADMWLDRAAKLGVKE